MEIRKYTSGATEFRNIKGGDPFRFSSGHAVWVKTSKFTGGHCGAVALTDGTSYLRVDDDKVVCTVRGAFVEE
jgi:hypothetical protein